jgi:alkanesulfonate monooxygenase SsuD/methylene tetrahydromethanopterin reductase-like flavin-dependent oxidoreductase (luciferase family)
MEAWFFTELPYPHVPMDEITSMRVNIPNRYFDPKIGAELYNRYLDEYMYADEMGLNFMVNEHHQTATCLDACGPLTAAILARQTKNGRIVILGNPVANLRDPVRAAEEMAMIDCISHGRLDAGFVRGVPYELFGSNCNPAETTERMWEAIDLCVKAWTTHDGPFNFEGRFIHKRHVNIWPRPYQQPHPPIWCTGGGDTVHACEVIRRGYTYAMFLTPYDKIRAVFDACRTYCVDNGLPPPPPDKFAYLPLVYVSDNEADAADGAQELTWYLTSGKSEPQFNNPPGYVPVKYNILALKGAFERRTAEIRRRGLDYQIEQGVIIAGTPDQVVKQIETLYERVGGFGQLLMMMQAGFLSHERTMRSIKLFSEEVYPRIRHLGAVESAAAKIAS